MKNNIDKIKKIDPVAGEIIDLLGKVFPGCGGFYIPPSKGNIKKAKKSLRK